MLLRPSFFKINDHFLEMMDICAFETPIFHDPIFWRIFENASIFHLHDPIYSSVQLVHPLHGTQNGSPDTFKAFPTKKPRHRRVILKFRMFFFLSLGISQVLAHKKKTQIMDENVIIPIKNASQDVKDGISEIFFGDFFFRNRFNKANKSILKCLYRNLEKIEDIQMFGSIWVNHNENGVLLNFFDRYFDPQENTMVSPRLQRFFFQPVGEKFSVLWDPFSDLQTRQAKNAFENQ